MNQKEPMDKAVKEPEEVRKAKEKATEKDCKLLKESLFRFAEKE